MGKAFGVREEKIEESAVNVNRSRNIRKFVPNTTVLQKIVGQ